MVTCGCISIQRVCATTSTEPVLRGHVSGAKKACGCTINPGGAMSQDCSSGPAVFTSGPRQRQIIDLGSRAGKTWKLLAVSCWQPRLHHGFLLHLLRHFLPSLREDHGFYFSARYRKSVTLFSALENQARDEKPEPSPAGVSCQRPRSPDDAVESHPDFTGTWGGMQHGLPLLTRPGPCVSVVMLRLTCRTTRHVSMQLAHLPETGPVVLPRNDHLDRMKLTSPHLVSSLLPSSTGSRDLPQGTSVFAAAGNTAHWRMRGYRPYQMASVLRHLSLQVGEKRVCLSS